MKLSRQYPMAARNALFSISADDRFLPFQPYQSGPKRGGKETIICFWLVLTMLAGAAIVFGADDVFITKKDYPMAASESDLALFRYATEKNHMGLWVKLRQEGRAWLTRPGVPVKILERKPPDKVKIRSIISNTESWTIEAALHQ